ncbi:Homeodomain-like domain-containing protein [Hymenobacter daecheongensis DSM 21074]|uniref:Homeodomain-like domain-containing protein n=1 Tax=Hymenobacter daecheongensis DSM 21074 TaxID=1121955 RepID=A0A1M6II72_9BACT|nr:helix-turn-helix domain-containing protein [Hymenobacter daecheongensis]SHJ34171.1 Homeodomain-like domain-containing protein [Hymenobacter daecheongensis DSM 21074]
MGRHRHSVSLTSQQQTYLTSFVNSEILSRQQRNRALVLQHWQSNYSVQESAEVLGLSIHRVYSMRRAYSEQGFQDYLHAIRRCGAPNKLTPKMEAHLRRFTERASAKGKRVTLTALAKRVVDLGYVESICTVTIHKVLKQARPAVAAQTAHLLLRPIQQDKERAA